MRNLTLFCTMLLTLSALLLGIGPAQARSGGTQAETFPARGQVLSPRLQQLLEYRSAPVRDDGSAGLQRQRMRGDKAPSSLNAVLLMCDFSDSLMLGRFGQVPGDFPPPMQTEIYYDAHDSVFFDHLLQDVADYYDDVSGGAFSFNFTIIPEVVNLPNPMGFYGNHPEEGEQPLLMASEVVAELDEIVDFSLFDTVLLVHAGAGEETDILGDSPEQIYSTYLDPDDFRTAFEDSLLDTPYLPTQDHPAGEGITHVLVLPETEYQDPVAGLGGYFGSLGVYCFEVGLRLGMLSLSDFTPAGRPDSQGIGEFGLMGYGLFVGAGFIPPHPCAYNKYLMGWLDPVEVTAGPSQELFLTPCEDTAAPDAALRVDITGQEYYLLAYRQQDPDGNRIFTHPGDLNGNNVPDFYDADSVFGGGIPSGYFDPETDTRERLAGCEWDFFMSENRARQPYDKGAGSGVYIWHIDEGVVQWAFDQDSNLFNANPARKSVDLEEADGIQDLDSREPSLWQLGGDDDSFRGEDNATFGPDTRPGTESAGHAYTGILFEDFSDVVLDSTAFISYIVEFEDEAAPPDTVMGFTYADTLFFTLSRLSSGSGGPELAASRELPVGVDLRRSHLVTADLDGDGSDEIIAGGNAGEVYVLDGELNEFLDHDSNPATFEPFAVGTSGTEPVTWNLPAAVGNIDEDPDPEIVLTGSHGVYAFDIDGNPVRDLVPGSNGLYMEFDSCRVPAVLVPVESDSLYSPQEPALIVAVEEADGASNVVVFRGDGDFDSIIQSTTFGQRLIPSAPVYSWGALAIAAVDTAAWEALLQLLPVDPGDTHQEGFIVDLETTPGDSPVLLGLVNPSDDDSPRFATVYGHDGQAETIVFDADGSQAIPSLFWDSRIEPLSGQTAGGALIGDGVLGRAGHNGEWLDGWPIRPGMAIAPPEYGSQPLVCRLTDSDLNLDQYLFPVRDGRIYGFGTRGEQVPGWPVAGPAENAATPAVGQLDGASGLDLVAVGTYDRITGLDDEGLELVTETVTTLSVWSDVAETAVWPMWGGSPWHNGTWDLSDWASYPTAAGGTGIVLGSHFCYPSPLREGPLQVRASSRSLGRAMAEVYNLSGELVESSSWQPVSAREPFAITLRLENAVSGMYLCRLTVVAENGTTDHSVISVAVVR